MPAETKPPVSETEFEPSAPVTVPPQLLESPAGVASWRPAGSVSLKAMLLMEPLALVFWIRKVRLVEPPSGTVTAPNDLVSVGGPSGAATTSWSLAVAIAPALEFPFEIVFVNVPRLVLVVTVTTT